ncbi:hypothetical protein ASPACDRAFT_1873892 [Aspergillus aculeatus ATCC 16872]|uniref:Guanine nucleotide-exchange factor SEC12 n=1 Tax=Aspergillus aculeatus (strain ATCC 16872 / CBS 172.66 / WB 5094) TaxID=690307 RepID=A0A1L9WKQ2_ASPA1|nr:uncharacterized protein ASPACDRAFT_1873892 [Aspergillus aculeatus ATCC 16872]OJJ96737.1 hypothetical protein ASPACDRAFT_1873892 [Aspergillus aculeatus ATCC 16872]
MAPSIPSAKLTLSCPLFAADFDPRNPGFLLVAGGGGEGRSGVGNKIVLLDSSKRHTLSPVVDIDLSRDEDSVTSLAAALPTEDSVIALAGINSSVEEQKRDNNQHLRSFRIDYPPRKALSGADQVVESSEDGSPAAPTLGKTTPLSRASLFRTAKGSKTSDTYQRLLRLSPWKPDAQSPRVAAIATGLAATGEIVFFSATATPGQSEVIGRVRLGSDEEAEDIDIIELDDETGTFRFAYSNGVDVIVGQVAAGTRSNATPDMQCIYTTPVPEKGPRTRPKFRALRFLSPTSLLLLQNSPDRKGCELMILDLRNALQKTTEKASIIRRKKLRKTIKIGLGLDVCLLGSGSDDPVNQQQQAIIAVSGSDQSIELLTLELNPLSSRGGYGPLRHYTTLPDVHPFSMTKLCFAPFHSPLHPVSAATPPQCVRLASVSMGNTVVVHTLPLSPCPPTSRNPRYVLSMPGESEIWTNFSSGFAALLSILIVCFVLQAFTEIRGAMPPYLGATEWLPPHIRDAVARPYYPPPSPLPPSPLPPADLSTSSPGSLVVARAPSNSPICASLTPSPIPILAPGKSSFISCDPATNLLLVDSTPADSVSSYRRWRDVQKADRARWTRGLTEACYGLLPASDLESESASDDDSVPTGVFFGDLCPTNPVEDLS